MTLQDLNALVKCSDAFLLSYMLNALGHVFSTSVVQCPFNLVPQVVVTPNHFNYYFVTVILLLL